ncbi:EAL domain-containing protein [Campylobacter sp. 7477a]|uniref:EAL domain-containing protein n=1 Tax=Campylobacter sp. 7477a TaxID=2735741 RepID=UPI003014B44F|nr:EAL domain-containing protein [Campylobacter sp. 7477a]
MFNYERQLQTGAIKTAVIALSIIGLLFLLVSSAVFYYKYSNATINIGYNADKKLDFITEVYVHYFVNEGEQNIKKFQNFINGSAVGDIVLLKNNPRRDGYRVLASSSSEFEVGSVFKERDCVGVNNHDFHQDYYYRRSLPDNVVLTCKFVTVGDYIVGFKGIFNQNITGFRDKYFTEWAVQNLTLVFSLIIFGTLLLVFATLWFIFIYLDAKYRYQKMHENDTERIKNLTFELYTDPATGLLNKQSLIRDIAKAQNPKVVLIDIDDFGKMNDLYGKFVCDKILSYMANLIDDFAKKEEMVAYCIGADTFALLEDGSFFIDRYEELAEDLLGQFKGRVISVEDENGDMIEGIEVNTSIGFSIDNDQTLRKASIALKMARALNKDYMCYFKGLSQKDDYENQIERSRLIQRAIMNGNIVPFYQPIFDADKNILKYECLIRIVDSNETVSPYLFLDISKRVKRYAELEKLLIKKSIEKLKSNPDIIISINLSSRDMTDGDVSAYLLNLLNRENVADRIVFEIVEDESIEHLDRATMFIDKVKNLGAKIAIDDFGSGYSNFSYILKLRPDYLKIDGSLIRELDINKDAYVVTRAIVAFAKDIGIKTIAEYVHSRDIFEICKDLGVDEFQGFYLGAPMEGENI